RFSRDWSSDVCSSDLIPGGSTPLNESAIRAFFPLDNLNGHIIVSIIKIGRHEVRRSVPGQLSCYRIKFELGWAIIYIFSIVYLRSEERRVGTEFGSGE